MNSGDERERRERSDKKIRVNPALTQSTHDKLERLAYACGKTKTELGGFLIDLCLNNENIVNFVQEQHKTNAKFRIIPTKLDGELKFTFVEKFSVRKGG